jgi:hypothetical protein
MIFLSDPTRAVDDAERPDIGHPKLFMVGKASAAKLWPQPAVNNFVAAKTAVSFGWPGRFISGYSSIGFPAPAGQVC